MELSKSKTEWVKCGKIKQFSLVGRDYVGLGSGCHMLFINVINESQYLYHANGQDEQQGEGICTITGHKTLPYFAFAEKCRYPKVFIKLCPSFNLVCILDKKTNEDFLAIAFTEGDFIVTLNDTPSFEVIVWNWRNGQRIASMMTNIYGRHQRIKCNLSTPISFVQYQTGKKRITVWEMLICGRKCVLTPHSLTYPSDALGFTDVLWTSEGGLFVVDFMGDVYMMASDYSLNLIIKLEQSGSIITSLTWFKAGLLIAGPSGEIKHYKKSGTWTSEWCIKPEIPIKRMISNSKDLLIGLSEYGDIMLYDQSEEVFKYVTQYQSKFNDVCMIYPVGEYIVTLQHQKEVICWKIATGEKTDMKTLNGTALSIKENPEYPYVAVGYDHGVLELLSIYNPNKIRSMTYFNLAKKGLDSIYFTKVGKLIVAANLLVGEFYVIEGIPGTKMKIIATLEAKNQICDFMLVASRTCMRLFTIHVTSNLYIAGNKIVRYCIVRDQPGCEIKEYKLERDAQIYSKIYVTSKDNRDRVFHCIPLTTKCIHELTTKRGDPLAKVTDVIETGHQMKKISLHMDENHTLTYAYDGLVIIRSNNFDRQAVVMPHYRNYGGVLKAYVDPFNRYVVSLGRDNSLICTSLTDTITDEEKQNELRELLNSSRMELMFKRVTTGFTPSGDLANKIWLEVARIEQQRYEEELSKVEKQNIMEEFELIKAEVQHLLTQNLEGPEKEKLDIQEFNLDVQLRESKIQKSQAKCKNTKIYLEALIVAQDKVAQWIKNFCWDSMNVPGQSVEGIFVNLQIENYALLPLEDTFGTTWNAIEEYRKFELLLAKNDSFQPWLPKTTSAINVCLAEPPKISEMEDGPNLKDLLGEEEDLVQEEQIDSDTISAYNGTVTHVFVELFPYHYTQSQIQTFLQSEFQIAMCQMEMYKLKRCLNQKLTDMTGVKEREMGFVYERNARLRHCIAELNFFSEVKIDISVEDPVWSTYEKPDTLLSVKDNEVSIVPYISPSEQAMLDAAAAEQERIRLLLLADDFRERALIVMMNGVLEIKWEDEIKKDVPKPKCMLEKEPVEFNEDDLRAVMAYEEEVRFLLSERERYKKILEIEYGRVSNILRDGIKKYNAKVADFQVLQLQMESAVRQEHIKTSRINLKNLNYIYSTRKEAAILKAIQENNAEMEDILSLISNLQETLFELRAFNESLVAKEKFMERAFKKDFLEATPVVQEQSARLYKKRPKVTMRSVNSLFLTLETARCVVIQERPFILTLDCLDYLKSLDALDMYVNIPPAVDENAYALVCKHRRIKIESELRQKAAAMEVSEAESTIMNFQKLLLTKKEFAQKLVLELDQIRQTRLNESHDMEMQVVLRKAIVELPTTGSLSDFDDAVMISRKDVETINKIILKGGARKVKAMKDVMNFRRGILVMEWQHRRLRMQIEDLKTYMEDIKSTKLTKDLQSYLKSKARGQSPDKGMSFEQEIEMIKASYERIIDENKSKVKELQLEINYYTKENAKLDEQIANVNVDVCEYQLDKDVTLEKREQDVIKLRMATLLKRTKLVKQIQSNHSNILMLQTELELLRLRTFPTLSYTIFS